MAAQTAAERAPGAQLAAIKLPVRGLGLKYLPAIPVDIDGMRDTLSKLVVRVKQREQALQGLSWALTIRGSTHRAYHRVRSRRLPNRDRASRTAVAAMRVFRCNPTRDAPHPRRPLVSAMMEIQTSHSSYR